MTATEAGQPAKDPEDGRGATDADGAFPVDPGQAGQVALAGSMPPR
jgi:hypothetical protein